MTDSDQQTYVCWDPGFGHMCQDSVSEAYAVAGIEEIRLCPANRTWDPPRNPGNNIGTGIRRASSQQVGPLDKAGNTEISNFVIIEIFFIIEIIYVRFFPNKRFQKPPLPPPSKTPKMCTLSILYREIPYMGRLGPHTMPPPQDQTRLPNITQLFSADLFFFDTLFQYTFLFSTPCLVLGGGTAWGPNLPI